MSQNHLSDENPDAEAHIDIAVVCEQLRAGIVAGCQGNHTSADWTSDCRHGYVTNISKYYRRIADQLYEFSEKLIHSNSLIRVNVDYWNIMCKESFLVAVTNFEIH